MLSYEEIREIPCPQLRGRDDLEEIVETVIDWYYEKGFPYYGKDKLTTESKSLKSYDTKKLLLDDNELQQNMLGLATVNAYHPQMWETPVGRGKTPMEIFKDRKLFFTAIMKRIRYSDTKLVDFNIRKSLKAFGTQAVSNFRPTVAKFIYDRYGIPGFSKVLDPCAGYGGRLFGAWAAGMEYYGVDPSSETQSNNGQLAYHLKYQDNCHLYCAPFEDVGVASRTMDIVFTSPPYFDKERYIGGEQSWKRYPIYTDWVQHFLHPLITKSMDALIPGGALCLNVAGEQIIEDTLAIAGEPDEVWHMRLSKMIGTDRSATHKTEPIFVWIK